MELEKAENDSNYVCSKNVKTKHGKKRDIRGIGLVLLNLFIRNETLENW